MVTIIITLVLFGCEVEITNTAETLQEQIEFIQTIIELSETVE